MVIVILRCETVPLKILYVLWECYFWECLLLLIYVGFSNISLRKICKSVDFCWSVFSRIKTESMILFLFGKIPVKGNPYFGIFYTVYALYNFMFSHWWGPCCSPNTSRFQERPISKNNCFQVPPVINQNKTSH